MIGFDGAFEGREVDVCGIVDHEARLPCYGVVRGDVGDVVVGVRGFDGSAFFVVCWDAAHVLRGGFGGA